MGKDISGVFLHDALQLLQMLSLKAATSAKRRNCDPKRRTREQREQQRNCLTPTLFCLYFLAFHPMQHSFMHLNSKLAEPGLHNKIRLEISLFQPSSFCLNSSAFNLSQIDVIMRPISWLHHANLQSPFEPHFSEADDNYSLNTRLSPQWTYFSSNERSAFSCE